MYAGAEFLKPPRQTRVSRAPAVEATKRHDSVCEIQKGSVASFARSAALPAYSSVGGRGPSPFSPGPFNDDVHIESYRAAPLTFSHMQRKGVREDFDGCSGRGDRIRRAIRGISPLAQETPLAK